MAAKRNLLYLANQTASKVGGSLLDRSRWRLGFDSVDEPNPHLIDTGTADRAIVPYINEVIAEMVDTGYSKCLWKQAVTQGVAQYQVNDLVSEIVWVRYKGLPLRPMRGASLYNAEPGLFLTDNNTPANGDARYYINDVFDIIELTPAPDATDADGTYSLQYLAETAQPDLVLSTDIPARIPVAYHDRVSDGAAAKIIAVILTDPFFTDIAGSADAEQGYRMRQSMVDAMSTKFKIFNGKYNEALDKIRSYAQGGRSEDDYSQVAPMSDASGHATFAGGGEGY